MNEFEAALAGHFRLTLVFEDDIIREAEEKQPNGEPYHVLAKKIVTIEGHLKGHLEIEKIPGEAKISFASPKMVGRLITDDGSVVNFPVVGLKTEIKGWP